MPQVPYNPVPEGPDFRPSGPLAPQTSPQAFGVNVGEAITRFGGDIKKSSDELWNRAMWIQALRNDSEARDMNVRAINETSDIVGDFNAQKGQNPANNWQSFKEKLQGKLDEIGQGASNPMVQKLYKDQSQSFYAREVIGASRHMAEETKRHASQSIQAQIETHHSLNQQRPDDLQGAVDRKKENDALLETQGQIEGWDDGQLKDEQAKSASKGLISTLRGIAIKSASGSRSFMEEHIKPDSAGGAFYGDDRTLAEKIVQDTENGLGAKQIEQGLVGPGAGDYLTRLRRTEEASSLRTGDLHVRARTSTAEGPFQFTKGTYADVRAAHPELNLPPSMSQITNMQQWVDAEKAFRTDNIKQLEQAGINANQKNTYLAHLLGAGGAVKFWNGMKDNPGQPAVNLVDAGAARANRRIFFNPDGSPRTAAEAYATATTNFMGPGEFTKDSTASDLDLALKDAGTIARNMSPSNPTMEENAKRLVEMSFNRVKLEHNAAQNQTQNELETYLLGNGDPNKRITNTDWLNDPIMNAKYVSLDGARQRIIDNIVKSNLKAADAPTSAMKAKAITVIGSFNQGSGKYLDYDPSELTPTLAAQVSVAKQKYLRHQEQDVNVRRAIEVSRDYIKAGQIPAGSDEYDHFYGEMDQRVQDYMKANDGKPPPDPTVREWAKDMISSTGGWSGFFGAQKFNVPSAFQDKVKKLWPKYRTDELTTIKMGRFYQWTLDNPDWEERLTRDRTASE